MNFKLQRPFGQSGFTLVELMVVVVIVAVLGSIAIPGYTDYVARARRETAQQQLLEIASRQEQFFMDNKTYASSLASLGYNNNIIGTDENGNVVEFLDEDMTYAYVVWVMETINGTVTDYRIGGISWGVQRSRDEDCVWHYLDADGAQTSYGYSGAADLCW